MRNKVFVGAFLCLIACISWGAMFPVADRAFEHINPFYFTIYRYGTAAIILILLLLWREGLSAFRLEGKGLLLWFFGTMGFVIYNIGIFWGQNLLGEPGIMVASIMESVMPMISIVIVWIMFRNTPHIFTFVCVIIAFVGAALVITNGDIGSFLSATNQVIPSLITFIAVVGWVVYTMGGGSFQGWSALRYSTLSCAIGTLTALVIVLIATWTGYVSFPTWEITKAVSPHITFMVIFPGVIALVGWNYGISIIKPLNGLLFQNFVPVTTLTISFIQGNTITKFDVLGTVFIIFALIANNIYIRIQQRKTHQKVKHVKLQESPS